MRVAIQEPIAKSDGVAFRCTLSGSASDRWLEVPAWMFERGGYPEQARVAETARLEMAALSTLAVLLREALKNEPAPSNTLFGGALRSSHDPNRREDHGDQSIGASIVRSGSASKAGRQQSSFADRPIRRRIADASDADLGLQELSEATRGTLTHLMTLLILDHARTTGADAGMEADHDL
jgi:hypothetical protein